MNVLLFDHIGSEGLFIIFRIQLFTRNMMNVMRESTSWELFLDSLITFGSINITQVMCIQN